MRQGSEKYTAHPPSLKENTSQPQRHSARLAIKRGREHTNGTTGGVLDASAAPAANGRGEKRVKAAAAEEVDVTVAVPRQVGARGRATTAAKPPQQARTLKVAALPRGRVSRLGGAVVESAQPAPQLEAVGREVLQLEPAAATVLAVDGAAAKVEEAPLGQPATVPTASGSTAEGDSEEGVDDAVAASISAAAATAAAEPLSPPAPSPCTPVELQHADGGHALASNAARAQQAETLAERRGVSDPVTSAASCGTGAAIVNDADIDAIGQLMSDFDDVVLGRPLVPFIPQPIVLVDTDGLAESDADARQYASDSEEAMMHFLDTNEELGWGGKPHQ